MLSLLYEHDFFEKPLHTFRIMFQIRGRNGRRAAAGTSFATKKTKPSRQVGLGRRGAMSQSPAGGRSGIHRQVLREANGIETIWWLDG
jgi:hypothetical protein